MNTDKNDITKKNDEFKDEHRQEVLKNLYGTIETNHEDITLVIDKPTLKRYEEYYFKKYPRRHKFPIAKPIIPSVNEWMIMKRPAMNTLKGQWKEFIIWLVDEYGYSNLNIVSCMMSVVLYFDSHRRHDGDNYTPKFVNDGLTASGMIVDDDFGHILRVVIEGGYDKLNPRTEIRLTYIRTE